MAGQDRGGWVSQARLQISQRRTDESLAAALAQGLLVGKVYVTKEIPVRRHAASRKSRGYGRDYEGSTEEMALSSGKRVIIAVLRNLRCLIWFSRSVSRCWPFLISIPRWS